MRSVNYRHLNSSAAYTGAGVVRSNLSRDFENAINIADMETEIDEVIIAAGQKLSSLIHDDDWKSYREGDQRLLVYGLVKATKSMSFGQSSR